MRWPHYQNCVLGSFPLSQLGYFFSILPGFQPILCQTGSLPHETLKELWLLRVHFPLLPPSCFPPISTETVKTQLLFYQTNSIEYWTARLASEVSRCVINWSLGIDSHESPWWFPSSTAHRRIGSSWSGRNHSSEPIHCSQTWARCGSNVVSLFPWAMRSKVRVLTTRTDWFNESVMGHIEKGAMGYPRHTLQHKTGK